MRCVYMYLWKIQRINYKTMTSADLYFRALTLRRSFFFAYINKSYLPICMMYYFLYLAFDAYTYTSQKWFMRIGFRALRKISLWCTLATYIYNTRARRDILFKVSVFKTLLYSSPPSAMLASVIYEDKTRFLSIIYTRARVQMLTAYVCVHARVRSLVYIRVRSAALRDKYLYEYLNLEWRRARASESRLVCLLFQYQSSVLTLRARSIAIRIFSANYLSPSAVARACIYIYVSASYCISFFPFDYSVLFDSFVI